MAVWHISMNEQFVTNIWIATKWTVRIYISVIAELEYVKVNSFACLRGVLFERWFHIQGLYTCTYWWAKDLGLGIHACSNTVYTHTTTSHIGITFDLFFPSSYKRSIQSLISDRLIRRSYTGELNELINYF